MPNSKSERPDGAPDAGAAEAERRFLHDVATPIAVAVASLERFVEDSEAMSALNESAARRARRAYEAVVQASDLLVRERERIRAKLSST